MIRRCSPLHDRVAAGILDAAAMAFAERGESASMAQIAQAVGIGRATLYRYYPTREALLHGLAEMAMTDIRTQITEAHLDTTDVPTGIARLTRILIAGGSKYLTLAQTAKLGHTVRRETGYGEDDEDAERLIGEPLRALLHRGITDGTLRPDLAPAVLAAMLRGLVEQSVHLVMRKQLGVEQAIDTAISVFLNGTANRRP
jgi:AcrR family transcriptional regulator